MADESGPAGFSFQKAKGQLGSAKEAILDSAELGLSGPAAGVIVSGAVLSSTGECGEPAGDPIFYAAIAGAAGGVTAVGAALVGPVVGAKGLIKSLQHVSPAELIERETALTNALNNMAAQKPFRAALLQSASQKIQGGLLVLGSGSPPDVTSSPRVGAILEARIDRLSLERSGSSEGSYRLRIKAHARLTHAGEGRVLYEQDAEYRSGPALFLDWTLEGAVQGVAETGYQVLAEYFIDQLFSGSPDQASSTAGLSLQKQ